MRFAIKTSPQDTHGIELGPPRQRSDRFEEACQVLTSLLSPQPTTTFRGRYFQLTDARCDPPPVQRPHPPLCVGGSGRRRTLRTAARFAQHWNCDDGTIEEFGQARDALRQHCAEVGRDPAQIRLSAQARFGGDPSGISATAAAYAQAGAQLLIISLPPPHTPAVLEPLASALRELC